MSKERGPTDYLKDDWGMTPPGGTNASGVDETPDYDHNIPARAPMLEHSARGWGEDGWTVSQSMLSAVAIQFRRPLTGLPLTTWEVRHSVETRRSMGVGTPWASSPDMGPTKGVSKFPAPGRWELNPPHTRRRNDP